MSIYLEHFKALYVTIGALKNISLLKIKFELWKHILISSSMDDVIRLLKNSGFRLCTPRILHNNNG